MAEHVARRLHDAIGDRRPDDAEQIGSPVDHPSEGRCGAHISRLDGVCVAHENGSRPSEGLTTPRETYALAAGLLGAQLMRHFSLFPTPLGDCGIAWCGDTVIATRLPDKSSADTGGRLAASTGAARGEPPPAILCAIASMTALLEGEGTDLTFITCDFGRVDPFAMRVYAATRAIPAGETLTYGAIALQLGDKRLARNVGRALGRNPLPIIVPCHRVVGADHRLVGFSADGGVETKLRMLSIEGARIGEALGLFGDLPLAARPQG